MGILPKDKMIFPTRYFVTLDMEGTDKTTMVLLQLLVDPSR
jgi:hypothetical protein